MGIFSSKSPKFIDMLDLYLQKVSECMEVFQKALLIYLEKGDCNDFQQLVEQINRALSAIETTIDNFALPEVSFQLPDILGGNRITIFPGWDPEVDIGAIDTPFPLLAAGGIINQATMAVVGEAGPEAVIPLDKLWDNLYYAMEHTRPSGGMQQVHMDNRSINISFENIFNVDLPDQRVAEITRTQTRTALEEYQRFKYQMRR